MKKDYKKLALDDLSKLPRRPLKVMQIAHACGVCARTMRRNINRFGDLAMKKVGHYFMPDVVREMLQRLGYI